MDKVSFIEKKQVAKNVWQFYFTKPKGFSFHPGQYLNWTLPRVVNDRIGSSRYFTISLAPSDGDRLSLTTDRGISEYKNTLFSLTKGEEVVISHTMGGFYVREQEKNEQVFLSSSIGITPFYSMLMFAENTSVAITLLAEFESIEDILFYDELLKQSEIQKNIHVYYTIIHPPKHTRWRGDTGKISEALIKKHVPMYKDAVFSVVGSMEWVNETLSLLKTMQIPLEHTKTEEFLGY